MLSDRSLSPTTFAAGPDEQLITSDVYEKNNDDIVNGYPALKLPTLDNTDVNQLTSTRLDFAISKDLDSLRGGIANSILPSGKSSILDSASKFLKNGVSAVGGLPGIVKAVTSKNGPSLVSRLVAGSGITGIPGISSFTAGNLSNVLKQTASASLGKAINGAIPNKLGTFIGSAVSTGAMSRLKSNNINTGFNVSSLIGNITGNTPTVYDKDSTAHLMGVVAGAAIQSGMPGAFSSIASLASGSKDVMFRAAGVAAGIASRSGNVSALKDIGTVVGVGALAGLGSNLLRKTSSNYTSPPNASTTEIVGEWEVINDTYSGINPNWTSKIRDIPDSVNSTPGSTVQERVIDISTIQNGSPDFLRTIETGALNSSNPDDKYLLLASAFKSSIPENSLQRQFPMVATSVNTQTTSNSDTLPKIEFLGSTSVKISSDPYGGLTENEYLRRNSKLE